jgi:hypothetical protein
MTNSSLRSARPCQRRSYKARMRPALGLEDPGPSRAGSLFEEALAPVTYHLAPGVHTQPLVEGSQQDVIRGRTYQSRTWPHLWNGVLSLAS